MDDGLPDVMKKLSLYEEDFCMPFSGMVRTGLLLSRYLEPGELDSFIAGVYRRLDSFMSNVSPKDYASCAGNLLDAAGIVNLGRGTIRDLMEEMIALEIFANQVARDDIMKVRGPGVTYHVALVPHRIGTKHICYHIDLDPYGSGRYSIERAMPRFAGPVRLQ